jgi:hypothetical protein
VLEVLQSAAVEILGLVFVTIIGVLAKFIRDRLSDQAREGIWGEVVDAAERVALKYEQTMVGNLKAQAAAGQLNREQLAAELAKVKGWALQDLKTLLGPTTVKKIRQHYGLQAGGDLGVWLGDLLEAAVGELRLRRGALGRLEVREVAREAPTASADAPPQLSLPSLR